MPVRVTLITPRQRRFILAQWDDPVTGKTRTASTKTRVRREAERFAARLEDELNAGDYKPPTRTLWTEFRERYENEVGAHKAPKTLLKTQAMFNAMEELIAPKYLGAINSDVASKFQAALRAKGLAEFTIHGHLRELRKTLRWAAKLSLIAKAPDLEFPRLVDGMKGRPITAEEFDRFVMAIPKVVKISEFVASWEHLSRGLWLSSLRLEEAMAFHWTSDQQLCPDFGHRRPMIRIQAASEKGRKFRLLPITPEFAAFLQQTPPDDRRGFVFNPITVPRGRRSGTHRPTAGHVGKVLCKIGEKAGIKVGTNKFASAHDFRRAFGFAWSKRVMPKVLQELMRHESIQTTMQFYVGNLAEDAADEVWKAAQAYDIGNTSGNTATPEVPDTSEKHT